MGILDHKLGLGAYILLMLAGLLFLVGFGAPYWISSGHTHEGLWQSCIWGFECLYFIDISKLIPDFLKAVQAMEILAFLALLGGAVMLLVSLILDHGKWYKITGLLAVGAIFAAAFFSLLAVIIYGAKMRTHLDYAFFLTLVASLGFVVVGVIVIGDMRNSARAAAA